jgi:curved DNA-binding protein CbpA
MSNIETESMQDVIFNVILWMILPNMATSMCQNIYYRICYRDKNMVPSSDSKRHKRDRNIIYMIVVGIYLIFSVFMIIYRLPRNYYSTFGVKIGFQEDELKKQFRKHSLKYHPDRNPSEDGKTMFIKLRKIYDVLGNQLTREVYEKFGDSKNFFNCVIYKDYTWQVFTDYLVYYCGAGVLMIVLNFIGNTQFGKYWRFVTLLLMASFEAMLLVLPYDPISFILPNLTVAEKISVAHQSMIYVFIAILNIGPLLFPEENEDITGIISELDQLLDIQLLDIQRSISNGFKPFSTNPEKVDLLKKAIEEKYVDRGIEKYGKTSQIFKRNSPLNLNTGRNE